MERLKNLTQKYRSKLAGKVNLGGGYRSVRNSSRSAWGKVNAWTRRNSVSLYVLLAFIMLVATIVLLAYNLSQFQNQTEQRQAAQEEILRDLEVTAKDINKKSDDNTDLIICVLLALNVEVDNPDTAEQQCRRGAQNAQPVENNYIENYYIQESEPQEQPKQNPDSNRPSCEKKIVKHCI